MEKYVDCHNCQNQYDCERTYLGGCTDGKEWEQEEKKLTDEEIVKALEFCAKDSSCLWDSKCPLRNDKDCHVTLSRKALDLIHRLQAENERLTEERDVYLDDCSAIRHKLRQEIEEKFELQKQVDELTEKLGKVLLGVKADELLVAKGVEQAVKDTAKEIFTDLLKEFSIRKSCGNADVVVREMASRKGVEVE